MKKCLVIIVFLGLLAVSCQKDETINNFAAKIKFDITSHLLEGKKINCIDIDSKGNAYAGAGYELYFIKGGRLKSYILDFEIRSVAIAPDETVWIGTNGGGLAHLDKDGFTWYTVANSDFPRDYISDVEIDPEGKVWFSSSAFRTGGLGVCDDGKFEFYTPENSPLNQNIIDEIEIGQDGLVYVATAGTVGRSNIYRISDKSWDCLGEADGSFYWVFSFTISPAGIIYLIEDFSLSSAFHTSNPLYKFIDNKWAIVPSTEIHDFGFFAHLKADKRNFCWFAGKGEDGSAVLHVYNGESWVSSAEGLLPNDYITTIEVDSDNNIWVGTFYNGIFILNQ
jgi:ligand-binding sensor domain-containing protein